MVVCKEMCLFKDFCKNGGDVRCLTLMATLKGAGVVLYTAIWLKLYFNLTVSSPLKDGVDKCNNDCTYLTDNSGAVNTESVTLIMSATEGTVRKFTL